MMAVSLSHDMGLRHILFSFPSSRTLLELNAHKKKGNVTCTVDWGFRDKNLELLMGRQIVRTSGSSVHSHSVIFGTMKALTNLY